MVSNVCADDVELKELFCLLWRHLISQYQNLKALVLIVDNDLGIELTTYSDDGILKPICV